MSTKSTTTRPLPRTPAAWFAEILVAMKDARATKPFALIIGTVLTEANLFQLAPHVAFKFRGLNPSEKERERVVEAALANYVVHADRAASSYVPGLERNPGMAFALCYVATHLILEFITEIEAAAIMSWCEERLDQ